MSSSASTTVPATSAASAVSSSASATKPSRPLLMLPGPIEFSPAVLSSLGEQTLGHLAPPFMEEFSLALKYLRNVFLADESCQPLILSGSGTLGWEVVAANLLEAPSAGDNKPNVLVVNTGYFSDSWRDCFTAFSHNVVQVHAPTIGDTVSVEAVVEALKANPTIKLVALTQVDTSTAVLNDIEALSKAVKSVNEGIFVAVDGVCSIGGEPFQQSNWGIDATLTCSQKALGCPPGLCIMMFSKRAVEFIEKRSTRIPSYYANLKNWFPIMRAYESKQGSYFATPNVNLIRALYTALKLIVVEEGGIEVRVKEHIKQSTALKHVITTVFGLNFVTKQSHYSAHTLSAILFPTGDGIDSSKLLPAMVQNGVICAGGLHKEIKATYFRIGHMGYSVMNKERKDFERVVAAIEAGLIAAGVKVEKGKAVEEYRKAMQ